MERGKRMLIDIDEMRELVRVNKLMGRDVEEFVRALDLVEKVAVRVGNVLECVDLKKNENFSEHDIILKSEELVNPTKRSSHMSEEQIKENEIVPEVQEEENEMGKKVVKKPELKSRKKKVEEVVEKKSVRKEKVVEDKKERKPREKKKALKLNVPKGVEVKETKYVVTAEQGNKRMWMRGSSVGLTVKTSGLKGFKAVTEEDAKKNHLGKTRMLGKVGTQEELDEVMKKYFA